MFKKYMNKKTGEIVEAFPEELCFAGASKGNIYWYINDCLGLMPDKEFNEQYELIEE